MDENQLPLSPGVQGFLKAMHEVHPGNAPLGATEWLVLLLRRYGPLVESLSPGFNASRDLPDLVSAVKRGERGTVVSEKEILERAAEQARNRGRSDVGERDLAAAILIAAVKPVLGPGPTKEAVQGGPKAPAGAPKELAEKRPTPSLDQFGRDLVVAAARGELPTILGRDEEIDLAIETLCRRVKRNPLLVGPAGTGKTAIVEGLAQRVLSGKVPPPLKGIRIIALQPSTLVAGANYVGDQEKRMQAVVKEASQPGIVLFIDEVHAIVGTGGREGTGDFANQLKPALARGDFACIAATTDDEYRKFIEADKALERRFQPIRIRELTPAQTLVIVRALRDDAIKNYGVTVPDVVLEWLVETASSYMPNRRFPDKAVDLFDQTVAYARRTEITEIGPMDAERVVERILGISLRERAGLDQLKTLLPERGLLTAPDAEKLVERLEVTTHGFDVRVARPNAVVMLRGKAGNHAAELATTLAQVVYGGSDRVIRIDFGRLTTRWEATSLLGSGPGYVGYDDRHELDQVIEMPWSVVICDRIDRCHPQVLSAFEPALSQGVVTDMKGRRIYFSDAIVLLTVETGAAADAPAEVSRPVVGFGKEGRVVDGEIAGRPPEDDGMPGESAGHNMDTLLALADFVVEATGGPVKTTTEWITGQLLPALAAPLARRGIELVWDPTVVDWLHEEWATRPEMRALEQLAEREISRTLVRELQERRRPVAGERYRVQRVNALILIEAVVDASLPPTRES